MLIRKEIPTDILTIQELTTTAFKPMPFSNGTEANIINQLREHGDLSVSLVLELNNRIIGHIAFSPISVHGHLSTNSNKLYGLGPVSIHPDFQKQGFGKALILEGLEQIKRIGATSCALIGSPDYYSKFGFYCCDELTYKDVEVKYVQQLNFNNERLQGELCYSKAFGT